MSNSCRTQSAFAGHVETPSSTLPLAARSLPAPRSADRPIPVLATIAGKKDTMNTHCFGDTYSGVIVRMNPKSHRNARRHAMHQSRSDPRRHVFGSRPRGDDCAIILTGNRQTDDAVGKRLRQPGLEPAGDARGRREAAQHNTKKVTIRGDMRPKYMFRNSKGSLTCAVTTRRVNNVGLGPGCRHTTIADSEACSVVS